MASKTYKQFPKARRYRDFREMLEETGNQIDAVTVSIPDHQHYAATMLAIKMGKHVFTQKPLAHDLWEARQLADMSRTTQLATQMGIQGTSEDSFREAVETIRDGAIGSVREVHVWSNVPSWPQGIGRPADTPPVPGGLDWDLWLGTAPERPYHPIYHPFKWRGWWDFGTGALGDMGCHLLNLPFMALKLSAPTSIEPEWCDDLNDETYPSWSIIRYEFAARDGMPAVKLTWYDGNPMPAKTIEAIKTLVPPNDFPSHGAMLIGEEGMLFSTNSYGSVNRLLPAEKFKGYKPPTPQLPRIGGRHCAEWLSACRGEGKTLAGFDYAGPLTETVLLGCLALRSRGRIEWDSASLRVTNDVKANDYLRRTYRKGWEL